MSSCSMVAQNRTNRVRWKSTRKTSMPANPTANAERHRPEVAASRSTSQSASIAAGVSSANVMPTGHLMTAIRMDK